MRDAILDEVLKAVAEIPNPYPAHIFTPLPEPESVWPKLAEWCKQQGFAIDQLSSEYARWQREVLIGQVRDCIHSLKDDE
jgi:hypothetical protein